MRDVPTVANIVTEVVTIGHEAADGSVVADLNSVTQRLTSLGATTTGVGRAVERAVQFGTLGTDNGSLVARPRKK